MSVRVNIIKMCMKGRRNGNGRRDMYANGMLERKICIEGGRGVEKGGERTGGQHHRERVSEIIKVDIFF